MDDDDNTTRGRIEIREESGADRSRRAASATYYCRRLATPSRPRATRVFMGVCVRHPPDRDAALPNSKYIYSILMTHEDELVE